jgi:hypothetical protein
MKPLKFYFPSSWKFLGPFTIYHINERRISINGKFVLVGYGMVAALNDRVDMTLNSLPWCNCTNKQRNLS